MRNKIDYGIDLGTTNSAIARMENGEPIIKKNDFSHDTTHSCVSFNKRKDILVGNQATNVLKNDNARALKNFKKDGTNTFIEFKRTMGTTHSYESSNMEKSFTSEELSAEILKKLKSFIQDENLSSIVITVPAKFLNPQNEATMKAAKQAGFKHVELLQEPVAAATAYGLNKNKKDGYWLVFDFGGGTFDAALLKSEEGILEVKDTEGDNWLGGKNLDEAIVDQLILPYLQKNYAIDFVLNDSAKKEMLRAAVKPYAEEAKNQLSFKDSHTILTNLGDLPFEDENGDEPEIEVVVTQKEIEIVLAPIFQKAIDITKDLLKRNNLKGSDLASLILVGGPTHSPILRRMLKEQITENVDTSEDPMTVVARGAALFASTVSVSEEVKEETRDKTKLQLDLKYESSTVEMEEMINVKVLKDKTEGHYPNEVYVEVSRFDGAWSSGRKKIGEKAALIDVQLVEGRSNAFDVNVYDESGNKLECQPNQFSILQGVAGLEGMQVLPYHIGIGKYFEADEKDLFLPAKGLEKNKRFPATGVINGLKTRSHIRPGMLSDIVRIPIYQGDFNAEGSNPVLNNFITEVVITGETLPAILPEGSDVDITIKVDKSSLMKFSAYFPLLNHTEELEIEIKQTEPPTEKHLRNELTNAKLTAQRIGATDLVNDIEKLEKQFQNEKGSADGRMKLLESLRKDLLKLDAAEKNAEWPQVERELKQEFFGLEELMDKINSLGDDEKLPMDTVKAHVAEYKSKIDHIIRAKDVREAKLLIKEINSFDFELRNLLTGNAMDAQILQHISDAFGSFQWSDSNRARQLVNQGMQLANSGNTRAIRPLLQELIGLMPQEQRETLG